MPRTSIRWTTLAAATVILATPVIARATDQSAQTEPHVLRVCADPDYLPFSNSAGAGFENKIAVLIAKAMGRKLEYHWASYRGQGGFSNFLADNLEAGKCDVVMDLPYGDQEEGYTKPYYVSSYVFVTKKDTPYDIQSMSSTALRTVKIGYEDGTTPEVALKMLGLTENAVPFHVSDDPNASPEQMLQAVQNGHVGVMVTWEPAIGLFLQKYPDLQVTPVPAEEYGPGLPQVSYTYPMAMGVRPNDTALKAELDKAIAANKSEIAAVLAPYAVALRPSGDQVNFRNQ